MPHLERQALEAGIAWLQEERRLPLSVGRVQVDLRRNRWIVHHLLLRDPTDPRRTLVAAREVRVSRPFGRDPVIEVEQPIAHLVRLPDGRWNFLPLLPERPLPPVERFWKVQVRHATVRFEDYAVRPTIRTTLYQIDAQIRSDAGVTTFGFTERESYHLRVQGWLHRGQLRLRVDAREVPVSSLLAYLPRSPVDAGDAKASGTVWVFNTLQKRWQYYGTVRVQATRARWNLAGNAIPLSDVSGEGEFGTGWATWQARGKVGSGRVRAAGSVQWQPHVYLQVSAHLQQIPPGVLRPWQRRYVPWLVAQAPVDAHLTLQGTLQQLSAQVTAQTARASTQRVNVQDICAQVLLHPRQVLLPRVSFRAAGGTVAAQGAWWRDGKDWQFALRWNASNVDLARLWAYVPSETRGIAYGQGIAFGTLKRPQVVANLRGERLAFQRWRCDRVRARVHWTPSRLRIDGSLLEDWTGTAFVTGEVDLTRQQLALRVRADEVALTPWVGRLLSSCQPLEELPAAWVYARGEVVGNWRQPQFRGVVEAVDLRWRRWALDYLVARVEASPQRVQVLSATARRPPMEIAWQGELLRPLEDEKASLTVTGFVQHLDAQELLAALQDPSGEELPRVEAVGQAFFSAEGSLRSPEVRLTLSAPTVQVRAWSLTDLRAALAYREGAWSVDDLSARLGEGMLAMRGERDREGKLALQVEGERLPLSQLQPLLPEDAPPDLSGEVFVQGTLAGTDQQPELDARLQCRDVRWDVLHFSEGDAQLEWCNGQWSARQVRFAGEGGEVLLHTLRYTSQPQHLEAEGVLSLSPLESWSQWILDSGWLRDRVPRLGEALREAGRIAGSVTIPFRLQGAGDDLAVEATVEARDLELEGRSLGTLRARVERDAQGTWLLPEALLHNGEHRVTASGAYQRDGILRLSMEAYNIDLSWFQRWMPPSAELKGTLEAATLEAEGPSDAPSVKLTLALRQPQWGAVRAERAISGEIRLSGSTIDLSEVVLAQPDGQVRFWGTLPFRWKPLGVPEDAPVDLHCEASPQPLSSLLAFLPAAAVTEAGGRWSLQASLSGTRFAPQLAGELRLEADRLRLARLSTGLRDLRAVVHLWRDTVRLAELTAVGDTPRGGRIAGSGTVQFGGDQQERIDVTLRLERFWLAERNLSAQYDEQIRAFLDGTLRITGNIGSPRVVGILTASGGAFTLPSSFPEQRASPRRLAVNPQFQQVVLRLGENMWLNSPRLSAQAVGEIALSGSLQEPVVHGQLGLERGYVSFPTARFRLQPGGIIVLDYPVPGDNPFRVHVNVQANTSLSLTSPAGRARRYGVTVLASGAITSPEGLRTEFRSDPPDLSPQQIARALGIGTIEELLTGRNVEQLLQREVVNLFTSAYVPQLFSPLERGIEEVLQLREFRLEYGRDEPVSVTLVKRLGGGFSLSYWRTVATPRDRYVLKILYELPEWARLARRLQISISVDERQQYLWGIEGSFRF